jgi:hypothetical protein
MVKVSHRFSVWVEVPAQSGDGWSKYPDYSQEEIGRALRRALHDRLEFDAIVEHAETSYVKEEQTWPVNSTLARKR